MAQSVKLYTLPDGTELECRPVKAMVVHMLSASSENKPLKPKVPKVEIGKRKNGKARMEYNPDDPDYLDALKQWQEDVQNWENQKSYLTIRYILEKGVATDAPEDFVEDNWTYLADKSEAECKYMWIMSLLDDDELQKLTSFIMGSAVPTEDGVNDAMDRFHADGDGNDSSNGLQLSE